MTVTVDVVLGCALGDVEASARGLRADAQMIAGICNRVPGHAASWSGEAAGAATGRLDELQSALSRLNDVVSACGQLLLAAVTGLRPARDALERAGRFAAAAGMRLLPDGRVVVPPVDPMSACPGDGGLAALESERTRIAADAGALARAALTAAAEVDSDAALALTRAADGLPCGRSNSFAGLVPTASAVWPGPRTGADAIWMPARIPWDASGLDVAAWWSVLPAAARAALLADRPDRIGTLDGVPAAVRHEANVAVLTRELAAAEQLLARLQGQDWLPIGAVLVAARRRAMLLAVRGVLLADPARRLVTLDLTGSGLAAVAIGDADTAAHVAVVVPGLEQDVTGDLGTVAANAERLRAAATGLAQLVAPVATVATVAWIGYRTATFSTVPSGRRAQDGGRRLAAFARGLDGSREIERMGLPAVPGLHLTLVGHSYGSVAVGYAMRSRPPADDVVLLGSPGVAADSAGELAPDGHVYVGEANGDAVADLGWFGRDPSSRGFGARALQTDGGSDPLTGLRLRAAHGHSQYFDAGTESVRNIAAVTIGEPQLATYGDMSAAGDRILDGIDLLIR